MPAGQAASASGINANADAGAAADLGDEAHMRRAIALSRSAGLEDSTGRAFGAVVVDGRDGRIIGEGRNEVAARSDPTWHAELAAIRQACANLGSPSLAGCTLYASSLPCPMCTGAIYWAGVSRVWYGADGRDLVAHGVFGGGGGGGSGGGGGGSGGGGGGGGVGVDPMEVVFFGREDALPPAERTRLPFGQMMRAEAAEVHAEYGRRLRGAGG